ncbi:hypothetical protein AtDm6_2409 [Acetobacter tropicalis]|uniref:Uncharacterized protein n=1 Tax=Acetobacter tropicalis TaxID=104102 RepID=A0A095B089_9PROT|nr:hypothetical protein AtDm6_2409 [Acetobacter tropicalis]
MKKPNSTLLAMPPRGKINGCKLRKPKLLKALPAVFYSG